ncbi:hypothetical protein MAP00_004295 [Monascus purpureus]|nr:hypothetical protein MAP00_004295 [Monascus purpureus]
MPATTSPKQTSKRPIVRGDLMPVKIIVVGAGHVGATTAYALLLSGLAAEIVLIDIDKKKAEGEVMDLNHAVPLSHQTRIRLGDYPDCSEAAIIIFTAGHNQKPGQTRMDLARVNADIVRQTVPQLVKYAPDTIVLMAANPVDVLTYVAYKVSSLPRSQVIGSGTVLDTARLRYALGKKLGIDPANIHADIIGEHGDTELPVWSHSNISGVGLAEYCLQAGSYVDLAQLREDCFDETRRAAYNIIKMKGVTDYGIASGLVQIVEAILRDENTLLTVSTVGSYGGVDDVALSIPMKVNRSGAHPALKLLLSEEEDRELAQSANTLKTSIQSLSA